VALLKVNNLTVSFSTGVKKNTVIDNISFSIEENETVGLVGESGSGKTLTGFSVMGILPRTAEKDRGEIIFGGKDISCFSSAEMRGIRGSGIGIVFQEPFTSLNPVLRVGYQISEMFLGDKSVSQHECKRRVINLLNEVRLKESGRIFDSYPHQLSGGQRQRVMIAMAVARNPRLLIADEPTTALDVTVQAEILQLLKTLKQELKMSILFITHDFGIINEMADRVLVMKDGIIVERGKKDDILKNPGHDYTRELIKAVPRIDVTKAISRVPEGKDVFINTSRLTKSFSIEKGMLRKEVGKLFAVKNVTMNILRGQTAGLVGDSGCGKSTLGKLLLGLDTPDSGEVSVNGIRVKKHMPKAVRKLMQIVFQDPYSSLDPRMRMGDIVTEGAVLLGLNSKEIKDSMREVLEKVQLTYADQDKFPHQFSGGQRQRIAIARALMVQPEFLVLDEPVSSLDVLIQQGILKLLQDLKRDMGLTYLFISHDLRVVESISDIVYVMYAGEIIESGPADAIFRNPRHPYTKKLLESIPVF